jgi:hypothetical protein
MLRSRHAAARCAALSSAVVFAACATNPTRPAGGAFDRQALVAALQGGGLTVTTGASVDQPFFPVPGRSLLVAGEDVQVFEFASVEAAQSAADSIVPDGSGTATTRIMWLGPPHFYRRDGVIALYVGSHTPITAGLAAVMGPQFAGR